MNSDVDKGKNLGGGGSEEMDSRYEAVPTVVVEAEEQG